ncbi:MAG: hypothetical protein GKR88_20075 [Flavobacteriaceae bacterium]|nr:MAG: hypothetical protein GKR88_20075 [Flavobacteriaceae bacterium]
MNKTIITFFFTLTFCISIISPTLLAMADSHYEIALIKDMNEEESNKEAFKDVESKILYSSDNPLLAFIAKKTNSLRYYHKKYNSLPKNLFIPPPEQAIV